MDEPAGERGAPRASPESETITYDDHPAGHPIGGPAAEIDGLVGAVLAGRYHIESRIGAGGMGIVYAARDVQLGRRVAIKLVRPRVEIGAGATRLVREAQAMAKVSHPNVATLHDIVTVRDRLFVVMELVDGGTLGAWLDERRRTWREIARMFLEAAAGLAAAHSAGFVHRDFKPENVLVGKDGIARVTDFGLARIIGEMECADPGPRPAPAAWQTGTGGVVGTPGYIAPEILRREAFDERADQFSFCVAFDAALSGRRPCDAPGRRGGQVRTGGRWSGGADHVPRWLTRIVRRGLSAQPELRWPTLGALAAAIERRLHPRRRAAYLAGLAAAAASVALALVLRESRTADPPVCRGAERELAGVWDDARQQRVHAAFAASGKPYAEAAFRTVAGSLDRYASQWTAMRTDACEATRVRGEQSEELLDIRMECLDARRQELAAFIGVLSAADAALVQRAPEAVESLDLDPCRHIEALRQVVKPPRDAGTRARVEAIRDELAGVEALRAAGKFADAVVRAHAALSTARPLGYPPALAEALYETGMAHDNNNELALAESALREAVAVSDIAHDDRLRAESLAELVRVLGELARFDEGDAYAALADAAVGRVGIDDELRFHLLRARGKLLQGRGQYDAALELSKQVVALRERVASSKPALFAKALTNLGQAYHQQRDQDQSIAVSKRALDIDLRVLGPDHPSTAQVLDNIGAAYAEKSQATEALPYLQRALAIREAVLGPDSLAVAVSLRTVAATLADLGKFDGTLTMLQRAEAIIEKARGPTHPEVANCWWSLAQVLLQQGRATEAQPLARRALAIFEQKLPPDHPDLAFALDQVAQTELALGHPAAALPLSERAVAIIERDKQMRIELAELRFNLARALWDSRSARARARQVMIAARDALASAGEPLHKDLLDAEAWLRAHGGAAP